LYLDFFLRLRARAIIEEIYDLKQKGLDNNWSVYQEHRTRAEHQGIVYAAILRAFRRYKNRRIKAIGSSTCMSIQKFNMVYVMSPLYTLPQQEAWKKIRRLIQNRHAYEQATSLGVHESSSSRFIDSARNICGRRLRITQILILYLFVVIWHM
jgi:hypothetical protein